MPTPCFTGSCSVDLDFDPVDGLIATARLADTGSLGCVDRADPDATDGLFVNVSGLLSDQTSGVAPGAVPCGQSLARLTDGALFAWPEGVHQVDAVLQAADPGQSNANVVDIGGAGSYNAPTVINTTRYRKWRVDNPLDCDVWCFFTMHEMKVLGSRLPNAGGPGGVNHTGAESFYVTALGYIDAAGDIVNPNQNRVDIHGSWSGEGNAPDHQSAFNMHALFPIPANGFVIVETGITVLEKYHFYMVDDAFGDGGVAFLHPSAMMWRDEPVRP